MQIGNLTINFNFKWTLSVVILAILGWFTLKLVGC